MIFLFLMFAFSLTIKFDLNDSKMIWNVYFKYMNIELIGLIIDNQYDL